MIQKRKGIRFVVMAAIAFAIILVIELCAVRIVDQNVNDGSMQMNMLEHIVTDMDETADATDADRYSNILGRELTEEEQNLQRRLEAQFRLIVYNNIGLAQDIVLPDGSWFLDEDAIRIRLSVNQNDERETLVFSLNNGEIMNRYRSYWQDSFYSYDKNSKEMVERYRYYQLVFDSFYIDDMTMIPEQVSIYKVECIPPQGADVSYSDITDLALVETLKFEVQNTRNLDHYVLAQTMDEFNITGPSYDYTCNGAGDCSVMRDCTLNGKFFSVEERKALLTDCVNEALATRDRDLVGVRKYIANTGERASGFLGGNVTTVSCEQNIFYNVYKYLWKLLIVLLLIDVAVACGIAAIVMAIQSRRQSR